VLDLSRWKGFGEHVGNHVIGRAVDKSDRAVLDNIVNEVESDVDVFGMSVILMVFCECNG